MDGELYFKGIDDLSSFGQNICELLMQGKMNVSDPIRGKSEKIVEILSSLGRILY